MKLIFMNDIGVNLDSANLMSFYTLSKYYNYEVWDLSPIYEVSGTVKNIPEAVQVLSINEFSTKLNALIKDEKIVIITNMVEKPWKKLESIVKKMQIPVICTQKNNFFDILRSNLALDFTIKISWTKRIAYLILKYRLTRSVLSIVTKENVKFDYLISAYNSKPETVKHFVKAHNIKYDEFLQNKESPNMINGKYILFIDSSVYYHPIDFAKTDNVFKPDYYLEQINHYFDLIEEKCGLPVVVALHPVSTEKLSLQSFNGRATYYGKTTQLIHHAEFVMSHYSTSLINAVLAEKPVIVLTSKNIEKSLRKRQQSWAFIFAKMCGFTVDSLDSPAVSIPQVDHEKYLVFMDKYLRNKECLNKSNSEIILELLKKIEQMKNIE